MEATRNKEYKRYGLILALIFFLGTILLMLLVSWTVPVPEFEPAEQKVELDFSGGGSTEGAVSESTSETEASKDQPNEPTLTHDDPDSPVESTSDPVSHGNSNSDNTNDDPNPANDFGGIFGGGNSGTGNDGHGDQGAGGGTGPNVGNGVGSMGSGRGLLSKPASENPIQKEGIVKVKIYVRKDGTVEKSRTTILSQGSTSSWPEHREKAKELANKYKFDPAPNSKHKYETKVVTIRFYIS